jgi:hypothetical protein
MEPGQVAVMCAELMTGIVLALDGTRAHGTAERYRVFDSIESASSFARQVIRDTPLWECSLFDEAACEVAIYRADPPPPPPPLVRRSWWRRLWRPAG